MNQNFAHQFSQAVSTDKPQNVQFTKFSGETEDVEIHGVKLSLPKMLNIHMTIALDAKELALSAKLIIDWKKISSIFSGLSNEALGVIDFSESVSG